MGWELIPLPGSSPLARGLLAGTGVLLLQEGIIPARAGFTSAQAARRSRISDHPRSRGVYRSWPWSPSPRTGSSPLARGLQDATLGGGEAERIIPARAGFTVPPGRWTRAAPGSSPLARGLRRSRRCASFALRIIPARAGFTAPPVTTPDAKPDHPRSRGVYASDIRGMSDADGSSPLARGLRAPATAPPATPRIIPARAGFTPGDHGLHRSLKDHPRSRGVYRPLTI